jgi:hypothetical protein
VATPLTYTHGLVASWPADSMTGLVLRNRGDILIVQLQIFEPTI